MQNHCSVDRQKSQSAQDQISKYCAAFFRYGKQISDASQTSTPIQRIDGQQIKNGLSQSAKSHPGNPSDCKNWQQPCQRTCQGTHKLLPAGQRPGFKERPCDPNFEFINLYSTAPQSNIMSHFVDQGGGSHCCDPGQGE